MLGLQVLITSLAAAGSRHREFVGRSIPWSRGSRIEDRGFPFVPKVLLLCGELLLAQTVYVGDSFLFGGGVVPRLRTWESQPRAGPTRSGKTDGKTRKEKERSWIGK